jgi:NDMA-dependent alcohol dehydrogenase
MQTRAAILRESPGKFEIVELELDDPRQGEIQVKMAATGLCHSDQHLQSGGSSASHYPFICGHEGSGIVIAVGPDTPGWDIGDHVVFSFIPGCGRCRWCAEGMSNLCDLGMFAMRGSRFDDPDSFRCHLADGTDVGQICGIGTFAEHTTVSVNSAIKVDKDLPLDRICLLGCAVGTGWGSAVYAADTRPGDVVIVMGTGGVGINAVQGAAHAGATAVIAVDPVAFKREMALKLGATHAFASMDEADAYAKSITNWQGADIAIVTVDVLTGDHVAQAVSAIRKAGTAVVVSVAANDYAGGIPVHPRELSHMQKRIQGALFGQCNPRADLPRQIQMYRAGQLKLDELVTRTYSLDEIAMACDDMVEGRNVRGVIVFD